MSTNTNESSEETGSIDQPHVQILNLNLGHDLSSHLSQHEIDIIYTAEYGTRHSSRPHTTKSQRRADVGYIGELTEQDRYDWILLYCGFHQDMLKIQQELRATMLAGADAKTVAPYFFGRFHEAMEARVAALGRGEPIVVEVSGMSKRPQILIADPTHRVMCRECLDG